MEVFMKTYTTHTAGILDRWMLVLGALVMLALIVPAAIAAGPTPVILGTAGNFAILAETGVSTTGVTAVVGDIGISPAAASFITGFALTLPLGSAFSTSTLVSGKIYAPGYADPTAANLTTAVLDMQTAYTNAAGRTLPDFTELYTGDLTGQNLIPGLYNWSTPVSVSAGGVTISGTATDVWIFQIAGTLTVGNGAIVTLGGDAQAKNIFWQVAGNVTLGTTAVMKGNILCQTLIQMQTGATLSGRALAQTAVTLDASSVTKPTTATAVENVGIAPQAFALLQNYPNPFNPSTRIQYSLEKAGMISLKVYNLLGLEVATLVNEHQEAGSYTVPFSASGGGTSTFASGVYFYRLETGSFVSTKKLILIK